jgi:predicted ATP-binding protein involved in virulence
MKIDNLILKKFKGFIDSEIRFGDKELWVLIGENGAGKSSILEGIGKLLTEIDYNLNGVKRNHLTIDDININANSAECEIRLTATSNYNFIWQFSRSKDINSKPTIKYIFPPKAEFLNNLKETFYKKKNEGNVPVFLFFESNYTPDAEDFIKWYKDLVLFESFLESKDKKFEYSLKTAVESAIRKFTGISLTAIVAENFKTITPVFEKDNNYLNFSHLSDGEKRIIDIIGKIISYFVVSFKSSKKDLLNFPGIVLIDEIEKHLHPRWQRSIIPELQKIFPRVQFIITTHSPQVLTHIPRENIKIIEDFTFKEYTPHTLGRDVNSILYDLFNVAKRPDDYQKKINEIYHLIDNDKIEKAQQKLNELTIDMGEQDIEIKRIQGQIELMQ